MIKTKRSSYNVVGGRTIVREIKKKHGMCFDIN